MKHLPFIRYKNLYVLPVFHQKIEFVKLVRKAFFKVFPDVIAVELPDNIKNEILEAVERLPYLSLIGYADTLNTEKLNFVPVDPGDSIIEAIRVGLEQNVPLEFIDLSVTDYLPENMSLPDDYALNKIGLNSFYSQISKHFRETIDKEKNKLRNLVDFQDFLEKEKNLQAHYSSKEKDILREMYMASNLRKMMPIYHRILFIVGMAHWEDIKYFLEHPQRLEDVNIDLIPHKYIKIFNVRGRDARFLLRELPYHTYRWVKFKENFSEGHSNTFQTPEQLNTLMSSFDKNEQIKEIYLSAKDEYEEEFKEFVSIHQLKTLFQYTRNYTITEDQLLPNLFQLLISSKNTVDDDFAWKVLDKATYFPFNDDSDSYDTMKISMEGGYDPNGRYIKLQRRNPYYSHDPKTIPLDERPEEKYPGEWRDEWEKGNQRTVSYPPEDIIEENYFAYIRKRSLDKLKEARIKIEEFQSSLKDGIAVKETIRKWGINNKIYVKNEQQIQGKVDTILVIFDEDEGKKEKYPFKLTWWAEHDKESNMSFYSTNPGDYLIGPGISHVEIGGLLSIFPPIYLPPVFQEYNDYNYRDTNNKAERLLKAGIIYSQEKYIIYVAQTPPRKYFYSLAGIKHRTIIHIPIDNFSHESLKTIKHLHILAGKEKRKIAHKYISLNT